MHRAVTALLLVAIALLATNRPAPAAVISQLRAFSGSALDSVAVTPFDTSLGTLDSINVAIDGQLTVTGFAGARLLGVPPLPTPYSYTIAVEQRFAGLAGKYFSFFDPARFVFNAVATGAGDPFAFATRFTYGFNFTAASDLIGFTLPTVSTSTGILFPPLTGIGGLRKDFFADAVPINEIIMMQSAAATSLEFVPPSIGGFDTNALMEIRYNYTPAIQEVPAPGTGSLLLVGTGAALWIARRRWNEEASPLVTVKG